MAWFFSALIIGLAWGSGCLYMYRVPESATLILSVRLILDRQPPTRYCRIFSEGDIPYGKEFNLGTIGLCVRSMRFTGKKTVEIL